MENMLALSNQSISDAYTQYARSIFLYIYYKVEDEELAHDLVQDTFLRLISYRGKICFHTVKHLLFIIARNLVNDYLRRYYKAQEAAFFLYENADSKICETEPSLYAEELLACEQKAVAQLPAQRRKVYELTRFEENSASDIAVMLNLSQRTVENHLFISRKEVRNYMKQCI